MKTLFANPASKWDMKILRCSVHAKTSAIWSGRFDLFFSNSLEVPLIMTSISSILTITLQITMRGKSNVHGDFLGKLINFQGQPYFSYQKGPKVEMSNHIFSPIRLKKNDVNLKGKHFHWSKKYDWTFRPLDFWTYFWEKNRLMVETCLTYTSLQYLYHQCLKTCNLLC